MGASGSTQPGQEGQPPHEAPTAGEDPLLAMLQGGEKPAVSSTEQPPTVTTPAASAPPEAAPAPSCTVTPAPGAADEPAGPPQEADRGSAPRSVKRANSGHLSRGATQSLDLNLEMLHPAPDAAAPSDPEKQAMLCSTNAATAADIWLKSEVTVVGRSEHITDPRVSSEHFLIRRIAPAEAEGKPRYELEDQSLNGTLVNRKLIKRASVPLRHMDLVELLPREKVGVAAAIHFLFHDLRAGEAEEPPAKRQRTEPGDDTMRPWDAVLDAVQCAICQEVMYKATTVSPCNHRFCSSCLGGWLRRPHRPPCPVCRVPVRGCARDHTMDNVISALLKANPECVRPPEALADLDSRDPLQEVGYNLSRLRGGGGPAARAVAEESDEGEEDSDGDEDAATAAVAAAMEADGPRELAPCFHCRTPGFRLLGQAAIAAVDRPDGETEWLREALARNNFEANVLQNWLRGRGERLVEALVRLLSNPNPDGAAIPVRLLFTRSAAPGALPMPPGSWTTLTACRDCAQDVLKSGIYALRERIPPADLPANVRDRENCWYGRGCRTQGHRPDHAERMNHICEQTRFH